MTTYFQMLGVYPDASSEEIELKWRDLRRALHPDAGGDTDEFARVSEAARVLRDPEERRRYLARIKATMNACTICDGAGKTFKQVSFTTKLAQRCRACGGEGYHDR